MTSNIIIAVMVQFILAIAPMDRSAAASDSDQDPDQLWSIGWDLSQDSIKQGDELRVKADRHGLIRERARILAAHQQSGLLQELMPPSEHQRISSQVSNEVIELQEIPAQSIQQDTKILEELLGEANESKHKNHRQGHNHGQANRIY